MRPYAKDSPACAAFLAEVRAVYERHHLALLAYDGSMLEVVDLPERHDPEGFVLPIAALEGALDARGTR